MALATVDEKGIPWVRTIDAVICGEWFSGHGIAESLGYIKLPENKEIADRLRAAFASWYDNGHTNEDDSNTIILKIKLTDGILFSNGTKYAF